MIPFSQNPLHPHKRYEITSNFFENTLRIKKEPKISISPDTTIEVLSPSFPYSEDLNPKKNNFNLSENSNDNILNESINENEEIEKNNDSMLKSIENMLDIEENYCLNYKPMNFKGIMPLEVLFDEEDYFSLKIIFKEERKNEKIQKQLLTMKLLSKVQEDFINHFLNLKQFKEDKKGMNIYINDNDFNEDNEGVSHKKKNLIKKTIKKKPKYFPC